ncbi:MAG TPA: hypothetical protein PKH77_04665 [Anaerolineae bacterium]|nr:hypothetical protein [Anaerolineae bacterium]
MILLEERFCRVHIKKLALIVIIVSNIVLVSCNQNDLLTPFPTYTPYPTYTPFPLSSEILASHHTPTFAPSPTHTPTLTPLATATLLPTNTPSPTNTLLRTDTATPTITPICNPFWHDAKNRNLNLNISTAEAREDLHYELRRWTQQVDYARNSLYLTYLSPQVIEALVVYRAVNAGLSVQESQNLLLEIENRLQLDNSIAFLFLQYSLDARDGDTLPLVLEFLPLENTMILYNQRRESYSPFIEYTQKLIAPIERRGSSVEGYILFPKSTGNGCNPTIDLLHDHSFDVYLTKVVRSLDEDRKWTDDVVFTWSYTLMGDMPLEEALGVPIIGQSGSSSSGSADSKSFDIETLNDILSLAVTFIELVSLIP